MKNLLKGFWNLGWEFKVFFLILILSLALLNVFPTIVYLLTFLLVFGRHPRLTEKASALCASTLGVAAFFVLVPGFIGYAAIVIPPTTEPPRIVTGVGFQIPLYDDVEWWEIGLIHFGVPDITHVEVLGGEEEDVEVKSTYTPYVLVDLPNDPATIFYLYEKFGSWSTYKSALQERAEFLLLPENEGKIWFLGDEFLVTVVKHGYENTVETISSTVTPIP